MQVRSKICLYALVLCLFLAKQPAEVAALVAVTSGTAPPQLGRRVDCLHLKGGALGMGKGKEPAQTAEPFPLGKLALASVASLTAVRLGTTDPEYFKQAAFLGLEAWQILMAGSYGVFFLANMVPGRLDTTLGRPKAADRRFFTPAGWAFAIWAPIFLGELLLAGSVLFPRSIAKERSTWLPEVAPFYAAASLFQAIWCFCFRPWALQHQWIPATMLTLASVGQFWAQGGVSAAAGFATPPAMKSARASEVSIWGLVVCWLPMSLHFGWLVAASALSWNSVLAQKKVDDGIRITAAIATCYAAFAFLGFVSFSRSDPLPVLTGAWALLAVSKGHAVLKGTIDDLALAALNNSAFVTACLCFASAAFIALRP